MITKSLNSIRKELEAFFNDHLQFNSVLYGSELDVTNKSNIQYPLAMINPDGSSLSGQRITYRYRFVLTSIIDPNNEDSNDFICSSFLPVVSDLIGHLDEERDYRISKNNVDVQFFEDTLFNDRCAGIVFYLSISQSQALNTCSIPNRIAIESGFDFNFDFLLD